MGTVLLVHRLAAYGLFAALFVVLVAAVVLRVARVEETPTWLRAVQHWTENLLGLQVVVGLLLLLLGARVGGELPILHYMYGSLFPVIALIGGRIASLRRDRHEYVSLGWGAFFAIGLLARAMLLGLQSTGRSLLDVF